MKNPFGEMTKRDRALAEAQGPWALCGPTNAQRKPTGLAGRFFTTLTRPNPQEDRTHRQDFRFEFYGALFLIRPLTEQARTWLEEHTDSEARWVGSGLVVEPRYIEALVEGFRRDGMEVREGVLVSRNARSPRGRSLGRYPLLSAHDGGC